MKTWSLVSQKGGSGKTTLACHLAAHAFSKNTKVIIVDLDPQHNAHDWFEIRKSAPDVVVALPERLGRIKSAAQEMRASLMIVDTPPHTTGAALSAIRASDVIIVPAQPNIFDLLALRDTVTLLKRADAVGRSVCVINGVNYQGAADSYADAKAAVETLGLSVCPFYLVHRKPFSASLASGLGVTEFEPKGKASDELRNLYQHINELVAQQEKVA